MKNISMTQKTMSVKDVDMLFIRLERYFGLTALNVRVQ